MRIPSGSTDRYIYFVAVDATDYATRETGLSSFTVYRSRNGAAAAAMTTPTINETDATNMPGVYELLLDEDTTLTAGNDTEEICFHITHAGMAPVTRTIELYRPKGTEGETAVISSNGIVSADTQLISGDSTAADNLETMLDGTGGQTLSLGQLSISRTDSNPNIVLAGSGDGDGIAFTRSGAGDPFDTNFMAQLNAEMDTAISDAGLATFDQVRNIAIAGAATNVVCESYTLTTGTQSSGTFSSTQALDGTSHQHTDDAGAMELYYQHDVGNDGVPTSVKVIGRLTGPNDSLGVYAYDWVGAAWDQIGTLAGTSSTENETDIYDLYTNHVGTGTNSGKVRIRFYAASGLTTATLYVDQILVSYAQLVSGIPNGSSITLTGSTTNTNLIGRSWSLALGSQDISGSYISQSINITGTGAAANGTPFIIQESQVGTASLSAYGFIDRASFYGTLTLTSTSGGSADSIALFNCFSSVAGAGNPTFDLSGATKTLNFQCRGWLGGGTWTFNSFVVASIEVQQGGTHTITTGGGDVEFRGCPKALSVTTSGSGTTNIIVWSGCPITISGTGGTVNIYGVHGGITDGSSGTTVTDYGGDVPSLDGRIPTALVSGKMDADCTAISGDTVAADRLEAAMDSVVTGTAQTGTLSTTQMTTDLSEATDDHYIGRLITWKTGALAGQQTDITDYSGTSGLLTFTAVTEAPSNGDTFVIT